jgi:hypothetical protein
MAKINTFADKPASYGDSHNNRASVTAQTLDRKSAVGVARDETIVQNGPSSIVGGNNFSYESRETALTLGAYDEKNFVEERGSIVSRSSINKKNLSITLPDDEPGTEYNPAFKTPADMKKNDEPAIRPIFTQ